MASQMHVAFSKFIKGCDLFNGGAYASGKHTVSAFFGEFPSADEMLKASNDVASYFESLKKIDNLSNLKDSPVWIWSSTNDTTVKPIM